MNAPIQFNTRLNALLLTVGMVFAGSADADIIPATDDNYSIQNWMADDGLPRNTVTSIAQSPDGFLWLGTRFSVIRFDGMEFKELGLELESQIEDVRSIALNNSGELFLAMGNQILKKYSNGRFRNLSIAEASNIDFHSVATGPDNSIWAIDGRGIIYKVVGEKMVEMAVLEANFHHGSLFHIDVTKDGTVLFSRGEYYGYFRPGQDPKIKRLPGQFIRLSPGNDGSVWMLTNSELRQLSGDEFGKSKTIVTFATENKWDSDLMIDSQDRVWICSRDNGLFLWENDELKKFLTIPKRFKSIFEDKEGSIWISFEGDGLYQLHDKSIHIISNSEIPDDSYSSSVHQDLVVTHLPGVFRITEGNDFELIDHTPKLGFSTVWSESDGTFWAGGHNGKVYRFGEGASSEFQINSNNQPIRLLFMDSKKTIWAGGYDWGLSRLPYPYESTEKILFDNGNREFFKSITEMPTGEIFAGTRKGNIYSIDGTRIKKYSRESGLMGSSILSLLCTSTGHLLAGTSGHGLAILDKGRFRYIGMQQGIFDPIVSQIVEDDSGSLWIGSTRGIFRIELSDIAAWLAGRKESVTSVVFGKADGLSNIEVVSDHQPGSNLTDDGVIEFATNKGIVVIDPQDIDASNNPPIAVIDSVQIDDTRFPGNNPISIRSGFQRIAFQYTAANFSSPKSIQFRCILDGYNNDWIEAGKERTINYTNLPPGNYTFRISASILNGEWSSYNASIPIIVVPRWWETKMSRSALIILFTLTIAFIVRSILIRRMQVAVERARQEMMLERERTRISKDLHDDLGARLTEIAFMADYAPGNKEEHPENKSTLNSVARRARKAVEALDETVWMIDPGKDVLEQFVPYVVQYTSDFCERSHLSCRLDIPRSLPPVKLEGRTRHHMFLAFKEGLNNVVRHAEAKLVKITISCCSDHLQISIADDGKGFSCQEADLDQGNGLANMRDRMQRIGGTFDMITDPGKGTTITFTLNL